MRTLRIGTPRSGPPERNLLPSLSGMRFMAAAMVLGCHLAISLIPRVTTEENFLTPYFYVLGPAGVTFFFVLSGFVLTWVGRPGDSVVAFWRRRVVKLFPNHLVTLSAAVLLMWSSGLAVTVANTVPTLFLVQSWFPVQDVLLNYSSNSPTWSLACEAFFYLLFPGLVVLARRIPVQRLWPAIGVVVAVMAVLPFVARLLPDEPLIYGGGALSWWEEWFLYYLPVTRALDFVLGVLMAQVVMRGRWIGLRTSVAAALSVAGFVATGMLMEVDSGAVTVAVPFALLIAAGAVGDQAGRQSVVGCRWMVRLGEMSFALYMVHWLVIGYGPIGLATSWESTATAGEAWLDAGLTVAISFVLAWALYTFVELPSMRRWSRRRPAPVADPVLTSPMERGVR